MRVRRGPIRVWPGVGNRRSGKKRKGCGRERTGERIECRENLANRRRRSVSSGCSAGARALRHRGVRGRGRGGIFGGEEARRVAEDSRNCENRERIKQRKTRRSRVRADARCGKFGGREQKKRTAVPREDSQAQTRQPGCGGERSSRTEDPA